jgi:hypothetical protein
VTARAARHRSPGRDPVVLALKAVAVVLAVVAVVMLVPLIHRTMAVASLHCPAPDHAVWAQSIGQAICGESITFGVKAR